MEARQFIDLTLSLLGNRKRYEDRRMVIQRNYYGNDLQVFRKDPITANDNPVMLKGNTVLTMIGDDILRFEPDHELLIDHMRAVDLDINPILWS